MTNTDHQAGGRQQQPGPQAPVRVPKAEVGCRVGKLAAEGQAPDTFDGCDLEFLVLVVGETDPGLVQRPIAAPSGELLGGIGVNPVQIAAEVYGVAGSTFGGRVEGEEWPVEGRQA